MSIDTRESSLADADVESVPAAALADLPTSQGDDDGVADERPPRVAMLALASFLSTVAAGILLAGLFKGALPHVAAAAGTAVGVGCVTLATRTRHSGLQYCVLPAAALVGALFVVPDASGRGTANLPGLVAEAARSGGLAQPPVPFDPGWRFLLVLVTALVGAGTLALAASSRRPRLAAAIPLPLAMAAAVLQPAGAEVTRTALAVVLLVSSLTVGYGAELAEAGQVLTRGFEARRFIRAGSVVLSMVLAVLLMSQTDFMFPQPDTNRAVAPERPRLSPPLSDRVLFRVKTPRLVPLRLGVLDVYDGTQQAWLLPPYDLSRLKPVRGGALALNGSPPPTTFGVEIELVDPVGHILPTVANATTISGVREEIDVDPRTNIVQLSNKRAYQGLEYRLAVPNLPTGRQLATAGPPSADLDEFLAAPPAPDEVSQILRTAAPSRFDRLQALRAALLTRVVAAGGGKPVDLPVARVVKMLSGGEATPYEITAAEALLARWAGVPSRVGYGYYGGETDRDGRLAVHPRHGAAWLEVHFQGYGWVPLVGQPLKAKSSTADSQNQNPSIRPSENVAVTVYVPIRVEGALLYFEVVLHYVRLVLPWLLLGVIGVLCYPAVLKVVRRRLRRRWASTNPRSRIIAAYAEFRDFASDLTYGVPTATPLEYLDAVDDDDEHLELAWLVTRSLWGDLQRDLADRDADRAEELSRSLTRRLARAQTLPNLLLARIARTSLRNPYTHVVPNVWMTLRVLAAVRRGLRVLRRALRVPRLHRLIAGLRTFHVVMIVGLITLLTGCGSGSPEFRGPTSLRAGLVPSHIGDLRFTPEPKLDRFYTARGIDSLVQFGHVYLIRHGDSVEGSVQVSLLNPDIRSDDQLVLAGIESGIGGARFRRVYLVAEQRVWVKELADVRVYLWFPSRSNAVQLVAVRKRFTPHSQLVTALVDAQHGRAPRGFPLPTSAPAGTVEQPFQVESNVGTVVSTRQRPVPAEEQ